MQLSPNFREEEFRCHDGSPTPDYAVANLKKLCVQLEKIRAHFKKPVTIVSGFRHKDYNKKIGGASKSQHLLGKAADITISGVSPKEIHKWVNDNLQGKGIGGLGLYDTFVHVDIGPVRDWSG